MTGAITCLQHWREICNVPRGCSECPLEGICPYHIFLLSDEEIADFVRTVEKEYKKLEAKEMNKELQTRLETLLIFFKYAKAHKNMKTIDVEGTGFFDDAEIIIDLIEKELKRLNK